MVGGRYDIDDLVSVTNVTSMTMGSDCRLFSEGQVTVDISKDLSLSGLITKSSDFFGLHSLAARKNSRSRHPIFRGKIRRGGKLRRRRSNNNNNSIVPFPPRSSSSSKEYRSLGTKMNIVPGGDVEGPGDKNLNPPSRSSSENNSAETSSSAPSEASSSISSASAKSSDENSAAKNSSEEPSEISEGSQSAEETTSQTILPDDMSPTLLLRAGGKVSLSPVDTWELHAGFVFAGDTIALNSKTEAYTADLRTGRNTCENPPTDRYDWCAMWTASCSDDPEPDPVSTQVLKGEEHASSFSTSPSISTLLKGKKKAPKDCYAKSWYQSARFGTATPHELLAEILPSIPVDFDLVLAGGAQVSVNANTKIQAQSSLVCAQTASFERAQVSGAGRGCVAGAGPGRGDSSASLLGAGGSHTGRGGRAVLSTDGVVTTEASSGPSYDLPAADGVWTQVSESASGGGCGDVTCASLQHNPSRPSFGGGMVWVSGEVVKLDMAKLSVDGMDGTLGGGGRLLGTRSLSRDSRISDSLPAREDEYLRFVAGSSELNLSRADSSSAGGRTWALGTATTAGTRGLRSGGKEVPVTHYSELHVDGHELFSSGHELIYSRTEFNNSLLISKSNSLLISKRKQNPSSKTKTSDEKLLEQRSFLRYGPDYWASGGGAGGQIIVHARELVGVGEFSAQGGKGACTESAASGAGGGGLVGLRWHVPKVPKPIVVINAASLRRRDTTRRSRETRRKETENYFPPKYLQDSNYLQNYLQDDGPTPNPNKRDISVHVGERQLLTGLHGQPAAEFRCDPITRERRPRPGLASGPVRARTVGFVVLALREGLLE